MPVVALLTDFGQQDWYVAAMKGVILSICSDAVPVDISHEVDPGDIASGAFILRECYRGFPAGTVFTGVVDPGVGTSRHGVAIEAEGFFFVGPDNGLFSFLDGNIRIRTLENPRYMRETVSSTFHGRDVFAPVAAHLAAGVRFEDLGPELDSLVALDWTEAKPEDGVLNGKIVFIDRFGNAITNIEKTTALGLASADVLRVSVQGLEVPLVKTFGEISKGEALAYFGSGGHLEIAVNGGNASKSLNLSTGSLASVSR